ncbi:non-homologous end joining protein Ku [Chryseobacterium sp. MP_3.2]|uniref:non-homologous end joining protein Ku n=1 Tax=Chryseobacterium sp. MP_3.2 TaxID=3071712 RepID=UPI002E099C48|nr:DNA end-binding protein Ku [Chryseobacterium sp. MP_3.2]
MRAIWNGAIGFGLVNIPIKLYSATGESNLDLDMLDKNDLENINFKRVNAKTGKEVKWAEIVKGYKLKDKYVVLTDEDFDQVSPEKSKILRIKQFVDIKEIDSTYFESSYFLEPQKNGEEAYKLLLNSLLKTKMAGIGTFILREKEILCLVRPYEDKILMVNRMRYPEEIRSFEDLKLPSGKKPSKEELSMAESLIKQLATTFDPKKFKNTYNDDLLKIIKAKAKGKTKKIETKEEKTSKATDLMAQLKASLQKGKVKAS